MKVSIHQPHYFPWMGYFDKMAKADQFVLLDEVQYVKSSLMSRNRIISPNGAAVFIPIQVDKRGYTEKNTLRFRLSTTRNGHPSIFSCYGNITEKRLGMKKYFPF